MAKKKGFIELRLHFSIPELILMQGITLMEYAKLNKGEGDTGFRLQRDILEILNKIKELEIFEINSN